MKVESTIYTIMLIDVSEYLTVKEFIDEFIKSKEIIENRANEVLAKINEKLPIDGFSFLYVEDIDNGEITFEGTETWSYGGYENYSFSFETKLLYSDENVESYIKDELQKIENDKKIKLQKQVLDDQYKEEQERKKYEELKEKYENN